MTDGKRGDDEQVKEGLLPSMPEATTIPDLVEVAAERFGAAEALVDGTIRYSFADLRDRVRQVAGAFCAAGVEPGDRVAIWAPNTATWVLAALGALWSGASLVPVNTRFKGVEAAYVLAKSRARVLVTAGRFLNVDYVGMLAPHRGELPHLKTLVTFDGTEGQAWEAFVDSDRGGVEAGQRVDPSGNDTSDLLFTSGTTGAPKGVIATHRQTLAAYDSWSRTVGIRQGDRYLVVNPFFHSFGYKAGIVASILRGATIVPHSVFDPITVMEAVDREEISVLPGPPTLFYSILHHDGHPGRSTRLRLSVTGAANVPVELVYRMHDELGFETVLTGYGLTEATGVVSSCRPGDPLELVSTSCGRPIPDVEVKAIHPDGATLPPGEAGELLVRGYNVMQGYFEDPAATAEVITPDGWLRTGDIATIDAEGNIRITDRSKDVYIVGGFNAYPTEIENIMLGCPAVAQVAVVGVPDERQGEVGTAFVVPAPDSQTEASAIIRWCRAHMANYKIPRHIFFVNELPVNASGKVLKYKLRDDALAELKAN